MIPTRYDKSLTNIVPWILLSLALWGMYFLIAPFVLAILSGAIFAIVLYPSQQWFIKRGFSRGFSAFVLSFLALLLLLLPAGIILWIAVKDGLHLFRGSNWAAIVRNWDLTFINSYLPLEFNSAVFLKDLLKDLGMALGNGAQNVITSIPSNLIALAFTLLSGFFFLKDGPALKNWFFSKFPEAIETNAYVVEAFVKTSFGTVVASLVAALLQSTLTAISFSIAGVPNVVVFSVVCFLGAMIPLVGAAPVWIGGSIYLYVHGNIGMTVFMIIMGVIITLSDNIVKPIVIRNSTPMHPLIVLISIFGGLQWLGPMGIFLGPVFAAMTIGAFNMWLNSMAEKTQEIVSTPHGQ